MAEIIYRASNSATIPLTTSVKGAPLTNAEGDGNMRSIVTDLNNKASAAALAAGVQTALDNSVAMAIALS